MSDLIITWEYNAVIIGRPYRGGETHPKPGAKVHIVEPFEDCAPLAYSRCGLGREDPATWGNVCGPVPREAFCRHCLKSLEADHD